jgi:transglutaminase-like putative cysteine protease
VSAAAVPLGPPRVAAAGERAAGPARPTVRILAFAALGLYGVLRWGQLLSYPPTGRLLGLLALAVALGGAGPTVRAHGRALAIGFALLSLPAALALSGVPLAWVVHLRVAVTADAIGQGISALPRVLVPYGAANQWVSVAITLGAAALLLLAALFLAFSPPALGDLRRAGIALPLVALAVVPSTLLRPRLPYLDGALLFALLAVFMWGERVRRQELSWALGTGAAVALGAMVMAPSLDRHRPWIDYQALAGGLAPARLETFDWSQRYGPLNWPQSGRAVLEVQASRADYWKAEDLDTFNGVGWTARGGAPADPLLGVSASSRARWTQTLHVTLQGMSTRSVIAAGAATAPAHMGQTVAEGASPGTWVTGAALGPGDSYLVKTYSPRPTAAELAAAGRAYPNRALAYYRTIDLPARRGVPLYPVQFAPFHSSPAVLSAPAPGGRQGAALVSASPYGRAYALARRLAAQAATPYAFVLSVQHYLGHGFTYDEVPPAHRYPLASFLFEDQVGYCQQFAGAMALLLRMGGIPARVAAGFTSGAYDASRHAWVVSDIDAHAWVEAWFPRYGWVRFDPTPAVAPARGGRAPIVSSLPLDNAVKPPGTSGLGHTAQVAAATGAGAHRSSGSSSRVAILALVAALAAAALVLGFGLTRRRRRPPPGEAMVVELERAMARSGRPIAAGVTLAALEHRLRAAPEAAGYVRSLRQARFGTGGAPPSPAQRRALRAYLRAGLGFAGALRALWALPPGWPRDQRRAGHTRGINS